MLVLVDGWLSWLCGGCSCFHEVVMSKVYLLFGCFHSLWKLLAGRPRSWQSDVAKLKWYPPPASSTI